MRPWRVQLVFVREQLDDDDGAGKGQRHGDVDRLHGALAHQQREREAEDDGEGQLPEPRGQRHRPDIADMREVELESDHEQQHGDADLGQQMDLFGGVDRAKHRRAKQNADHDVGNQQRLAQAHGNRPDHRGNDQQQGEFGEGAVGEQRFHQGLRVVDVTAPRRCAYPAAGVGQLPARQRMKL